MQLTDYFHSTSQVVFLLFIPFFLLKKIDYSVFFYFPQFVRLLIIITTYGCYVFGKKALFSNLFFFFISHIILFCNLHRLENKMEKFDYISPLFAFSVREGNSR